MDEEDDDKKKKINNSNNACSNSQTTKNENEKLELQQKNIEFKSFADFLINLNKPFENLSAGKLKRLSKGYFLFLG